MHEEIKTSMLGQKVTHSLTDKLDPVAKELRDYINNIWANKTDTDDTQFQRLLGHVFESNVLGDNANNQSHHAIHIFI